MEGSINKLLRDRYFLPEEETWEQLAERVGGIYPDITDDIKAMKFIPSSPTLMNGNTKRRRGTLSSCFPMSIDDSIEDIFDALKEGAIVTKYGGGVGYDFSVLRGSKEIIKTLDAPSSGPLAFIDGFNSMLASIMQGGKRRGAGMGLLSIEHPDILAFIRVKEDLTRLNRLNLSIKIPSSFYAQLEKSPDTVHRVKDKDGEYYDLLDENKNPVTVGKIWDMIIEHAWKTAEPGIFNETIAFDQCTVTNVDKRVLSNPCLTGDTLLYVADGRGLVPIKQLVDEQKDIPIFTLNHKGKVVVKPFINPRLTQKNVDVYEVKFDSGMIIKCTANHRFLTTSGIMVEAIKLQKGESIKSIIRHELTIGESFHKKQESNKIKNKGVYYFIENNGKYVAEHRIIANSLIKKLLSNEVIHHKDYNSQNNNISNLEILSYQEHKNLHKDKMVGKNNAVFRIKDKETWLQKQRERNQGSKNKNAVDISNKQIVEIIKEASIKSLHNLFCYRLYRKLGLPFLNSSNKEDKYRYNSPKDYCRLAGVKYIPGGTFTKLERQHKNLIQDKLDFSFDNEKLEYIIYRKCEHCGKEFIVDYEHRQVTFCSRVCLGRYIHKPFMFDDSKFSGKYLNHPNTQRRLEKTLFLFNDYKKHGKNYINFRRDYPGAHTLIRPNNIFCPSLQYLKENLDKVSCINDLIKLAEKHITSYQNKKELKKAVGDSYNHTVVSVTYLGKEDVYDGTVEETHTILIGGQEFKNQYQRNSWEFVVTGNCSEFVNVPYTSCSLGSINLSLLERGGKFDWEEFHTLIIKATRFINSTIDKNNFPIDKIKKVTLRTRPIGLGVMGLAHLLYKLGIPYHSEESIKVTSDIIRYLTLCSMKESVEMAKKEGAYDAFDYDLFMQASSRFFSRKKCREIDVEELQSQIKKYGIRNSSFTSIAPTGSISTIAGTSGGIEPVFALTYMRKIERPDKEYEIMYITDPVFEAYLDTKFTADKKKDILAEISANNGSCQKCSMIPNEMKKIFVVAGDIPPMGHLDILEAVSKNTSLSVSKTVNMPTSATKEEISAVYLDAYKRGIIGVTVYRDGCREGILVHSLRKESEEIIEHHAPRRPSVLPCEIYRIVYKGEKWIVFIGILKGKPYEAFAGKITDVNLPKNIDKGNIIKIQSRQYSFEYDGEILIADINKTFANKENDDFARLISFGMRHGGILSCLVDVLNKAEGDITKFSKVIARTLKKYITDGQPASGACPTCGAKLKYEAGCVSCQDPGCGWTKCG